MEALARGSVAADLGWRGTPYGFSGITFSSPDHQTSFPGDW